jgi:predicted RNA binding protein YcfA (HicA-like mRNA interferase family)
VSGVHPPLTYADVVRILKSLGFSKRDHKGTSHEQWVNQNPFRKVTVDKPKSPFSQILISSMARQAGVTKSEFYAALKK